MRMFLPVLALFMALGPGSTASAQTNSSTGLIVGVNFAKLHVSDSTGPEFDNRTGIAGGLFFNMPLGDAVSVQPEVLYSQKGAKYKEGGAEATIEVDYLDIPVLLRATAGGRSGLVVFAGPSFGFKVRAHAKAEFEGQSEDTDIGEHVESFDMGLVVGGGIQSDRWLLDGRYQWGLSNANKDEFDTTEVKNRVFSIMVGIRF